MDVQRDAQKAEKPRPAETWEDPSVGPALRREQELLRRIIDTIPVMIVLYQPDTRVLQLNSEFERLTGWSTETVREVDLMEQCYPDPQYREWVRDFMQSVEPGWRDIRMTTRDGHVIETSWANTRLPDGTQVGIGIDIRLRKHAESAIRESEERFRTLAEMMPQFVWMTRPDGGLIYVNRWWTEHSGLTLEQTRGEGWKRVVHPDDLPEMLAVAAECMRSVERGVFEFRCRRASDGAYPWFLCRVEPVRNAEGELRQWIWTSTDVDDQKRVEVALRESDQRKDQFLAMLGHELRTPLGVTANTLYLLKNRTAADADMERLRQRMERQIERMGRLIDDMQDITRISRGKLLLRRERLDLIRLLRDTVEDQRAALEEAGLRLEMRLPSQPIAVVGDAMRLAQILVNLLNNAAKFTDAGGTVTVECGIGGADGGPPTTDSPLPPSSAPESVVDGRHSAVSDPLSVVGRPSSVVCGPSAVVVTVRDTGIGITPEMLPQVFESFTQEETSLDRTRGGLGLGLALVQGLVELHGGRVWAASAGRGQGAAFTLCLPIAKEDAAP